MNQSVQRGVVESADLTATDRRAIQARTSKPENGSEQEPFPAPNDSIESLDDQAANLPLDQTGEIVSPHDQAANWRLEIPPIGGVSDCLTDSPNIPSIEGISAPSAKLQKVTGPVPVLDSLYPPPAAPAAPASRLKRIGIIDWRSVMSALSSLVALPLVTVPAPSIAAPERFSSDEEILQIAEEIFTLKPQYEAAREAHNACEDEYQRRMPEWPDDLLWGMMSPVSYDGELRRNGKRYLKCNLEQVECLRDRPPMNWTFIGANSEESHGDHFDDMQYPLPEFAHLYEGHPSKRRQAIAERMIAALDRWNRECDQLRNELRCDEMCERFEQISEQLGELVERLESLRAYSIDALRAKAAVLAQHLMEWDHEYQIDQSSGYDLAKSLIDDLGGTLPYSSTSRVTLAPAPAPSTKPDPIFGVIDSEKRAWDEFVTYLESDQKDRLKDREIELSDLQDDAANTLYHTRPQTRAGHRALIDHVIRMIRLDCSGRVDEDSFHMTGSQLIALLQRLRIDDGLV